MSRADRRNRSENKWKNRISDTYCCHGQTPLEFIERGPARNYHKPVPKFLSKYKNRIDRWACKCSWCRGGAISKQVKKNMDFSEQLDECGLKHHVTFRNQDHREM